MRLSLKTKIIFAAVLLLAGNGIAAWIQYQLSGKILNHIRSESAVHGIQLGEVRYRCSGFSAFNALRWQAVEAGLRVQSGSVMRPQGVQMAMRSMEVAWVKLFPAVFEIRANGIRVHSGVVRDALNENDLPPERLEQGKLKFQFQYPFLNAAQARRSAGKLFHQLFDLVREGHSGLMLDFQAVLHLEIRNLPAKVRIVSKHEEGKTWLRMPVTDLLSVSSLMEEELTDSEIRILSQQPVLAPRLLRIRNYARSTSYRAAKKDSRVPKDAYRHVLWSYLLTREFGEQFAAEMTTAHEIGAVIANTSAQHQMDYNNNAIGRKYARLGYEENSILQRLMKDPAVIRYSKDIAAK